MTINEVIQSALKHQQAGNLQQAANIFMDILEIQPNNIDALHSLGMICYQLGNYDLAINCLKEALRFNPANVYAYYDLGTIFQEKGELDEAVTCYKKTLDLNPNLADAYNSLGIVFQEKGQLDEAVTCYKKAVKLDPEFSEAYNNLGVSLKEKGQLDEAIICYQNAVQIDPNFVKAYYNLGHVFQAINDPDKAMTYYQKALQLDPKDVASYNNLGNILHDKGLLDEAINCYQKALQFKPNDVISYNNLGKVLHDKGLLDEAINCYQKAIKFNPKYDSAYYNLGIAFEGKNQTDNAISCYQKAIKLNPDFTDAHWNMSLALLSSGNFKEGWEKYEWRWETKHQSSQQNKFPLPLWDGSLLKGKTLFIYTEQGVGDEIMFTSCLSDVVDQADICIVECDKRLIPLFARSFPKAAVIQRIIDSNIYPSDLPPADFKISIGSLPKFLRPNLASFPQQKSYLIPDARIVEVWQNRFNELGRGMKVGISWRGGKDQRISRIRSIALEKWASLFSLPGVYLINLQYGDCTTELKEAEEKLGVTIYDWEDAAPLKDLDNFASQISALDLVISVDNAAVHIAGALGVPVWTLLPFACDWRWMREFEDTPWDKTMRLFRQTSPGDWDEVLERVSSNLKQYISTGILLDIDPKYSYKNYINANQEEIHKSFHSSTLSSSDKTYRCAIITPVGPGHKELYNVCLTSIRESIAKGKGCFSDIIPIRIDDLDGRLGRSRARNIGIKKATEHNVEWIFFLDADDLMAPSAFKYVSPYLEEYDGIWGSIWSIEKGETIARERPHQLPFLYSIEDVLSYDPFVTLQIGHFVKTSVALSTLFDESLDTGEDFDYYLRIWEKFKCIKIPLPFFYNKRGVHSQGLRSATGYEWRQQVENIIKKRYLRGWITSFVHKGKEIKFFISNPSDIVQRSYLSGEFFEVQELESIANNVRSQPVILEIGANIGNHAIYYEKFMDPQKIILIEPNPNAIQLLKKNLELNGCTKIDMSVLGRGAGKKRGKFLIKDVRADNLGAAYLEANPNGDIEIAPLDELIHEKIDFIKIDVEKMEMDVLEGAQGIIAAYRPAIFIEVMNENIPNFMVFLKKISYHIKKQFLYVNAVNFYIVPD